MVDAALVIFFNRRPNINPIELNLPLPADDAAWDADTGEACAAALGLRGPSHQAFNVTGSRRRKQLEMGYALQALEEPGRDLAPRATNAWGKFLLVHGSLVRFSIAQRYSSLDTTSINPTYCDWVIDSQPKSDEATTGNGHLSPGGRHFRDGLKIVDMALDKWKKAWDQDMIVQYPPGTPRDGYCRDGVHYYWLAKLLMQNSDHINIHTPWSQRFSQILAILKSVKNWVSPIQASKGQSIGSLSTIDESYGVEDMTKNMKLLFTPFEDGEPYTPPHLASYTWIRA